jgi:hypothetical protein
VGWQLPVVVGIVVVVVVSLAADVCWSYLVGGVVVGRLIGWIGSGYVGTVVGWIQLVLQRVEKPVAG